ncbi:MAG: ankyrin repeat domain-containing protein [Cellulosilyticaceae bacterium]
MLKKIFGSNEKTIYDWIQKGDIKQVKKILTPEIRDDFDEEGRTPIAYAIECAEIEIATYLIGQGAFIPSKIKGKGVLHLLIVNGCKSYDMVRFLVAEGIDIDAVDEGYTPLGLCMALERTDLQMLQTLLALDADINKGEYKWHMPLMALLENAGKDENEKVAILKLLQEKGISLERQRNLEYGGLYKIAVQRTQMKVFIQLIEMLKEISSSEVEEIQDYIVADYFTKPLQKRLVELKNSHDLPLHLPASFYDYETLDQAIEINTKERLEASHQLFEIVEHPHLHVGDKKKLIDKLIQKGVDMNQTQIVAGIEVTAMGSITCWPEEIASYKELVVYLLEKGASIEFGGRSALLDAVWFNQPELVKLYLEKGADVSFQETSGQTILTKFYVPSPSGDKYTADLTKLRMLKTILGAIDREQGKALLRTPFSYQTQGGTTLFMTWILEEMAYKEVLAKDIMALYFEYDWDVNTVVEVRGQRQTMLELLIEYKEEQLIRQLLREHPEMDTEREIPLVIQAMFRGLSLDIVETLVAKEKDINRTYRVRVPKDDPCKYQEETLLGYVVERLDRHMVVEMNKGEKEKYIKDSVQICLRHGASPNARIDTPFRDETRTSRRGVMRESLSILECAMRYDYIEVFELLLQNDVDITMRQCEFKERIEHFCCTRVQGELRQERIIEYFELLKKYYPDRLDINAQTTLGTTPLLAAAPHGQYKVVEWLIGQGAEVDVRGGFDNSPPIHRTISNWADVAPSLRAETIRVLLDAGADIEEEDPEGMTPLMNAAYFGSVSSAQILLERGARPNHRNEKGMTALNYDIIGGNDYEFNGNHAMNEEMKIRIIDLLVEKGGDMNNQPEEGYPALTDTIGLGYRKLFQHLLKKGADVNCQDYLGRTPLMVAIQYGEFFFVNQLGRQKNLEFKGVDKQGENLLHKVSYRRDESEAKALAETCLKNMRLELIPNNEGVTPLHQVARLGKVQLVSMFLAYVKDVNQQDKNGDTAFMHACIGVEDSCVADQIEIVSLLLEKGADSNQPNVRGEMPLQMVRELQNQALETYLLQQGVEGQGKTQTIGFKM